MATMELSMTYVVLCHWGSSISGEYYPQGSKVLTAWNPGIQNNSLGKRVFCDNQANQDKTAYFTDMA